MKSAGFRVVGLISSEWDHLARSVPFNGEACLAPLSLLDQVHWA